MRLAANPANASIWPAVSPRRFHCATRGEDTPAASGEDGVRSLALALAVRESARTGRRTAVDPGSTS